jgi:hypothetical protein
MKPRPFILYFFITGAFLKTILIVLWELHQPYVAYCLAITYDPVGIFTAYHITSLVFNEGIAPSGEATFFNIVFVITFALECAVLGYIIQIIRKLRSKTNLGISPSA